MDFQLFETLLLRGESERLDFKVDQYSFSGAADYEQSELLKDILAFANAWRDADAYILIGVQEQTGSKANVCGMTKAHLDDNALQQFVNGRTQRPVSFRYEAFDYNGKSVGIIHIPVQERPIYLLKNFGKLKANEVWIRRGSSTDLADPDEVARMGKSTTVVQRPVFALEALATAEQRGAPDVQFFLYTWLHNVGDATAYEVVVDFYGNTPDAQFGSDWQVRISPYNSSGKGKRRIALKHPLNPGDHLPIATWGMGQASFDVVSAFHIQNGGKFEPQQHPAIYSGASFIIVLQVLARDQQPVLFEVKLMKSEIESGERKRFLPRSI